MKKYLRDRLEKLKLVFTDIFIFLYLFLKDKLRLKEQRGRASEVAKIIHYTECRELGGTLTAMKNLVNALDKKKFKNYIFCHGYTNIMELKNFIDNNDIEILNSFGGLSHIVEEMRKINPDIVHLHLHWVTKCIAGLISSKIAGVKYVVASDYHVNPIYVGLSQMFRKWLFNHLVDINITETKKGAEVLNKFFWIKKSRIRDIVVGIPLNADVINSKGVVHSKYFIIGMVAMFSSSSPPKE